MRNEFKLLIVLIFNYFFVSSCNHISPGDNDFSDALKLNSSLNCQSLSEKIPRRYIKSASIVGDELFVFSQRSNSTMDANRFDLDSLKFKGVSKFSDANSIKEFEKGLLLETNNSTVIILSIASFTLSMCGTFLVRSGILNSVHTFANDPERGLFILIFFLHTWIFVEVSLLHQLCQALLEQYGI